MKDVNDEQLALIATMKAGVSYVDYHIQFHQRIAKLLRKHQIITDMSEEAMVENDLTGPFMPHGIGHPLGLQVHDVAGFMQDDSGTHLAAPSKYPYLRCTRVTAANGVDHRTGDLLHRIAVSAVARRAVQQALPTGRKLKRSSLSAVFALKITWSSTKTAWKT